MQIKNEKKCSLYPREAGSEGVALGSQAGEESLGGRAIGVQETMMRLEVILV